MFILNVRDQHLEVIGQELLVSGSVNVYRCRFSFSQDWDGFVKTAVFTAGEISVAQLLDDAGECVIPPQVFAASGVSLQVALHGVKEDVVMPTVHALLGHIHAGAKPEEGSEWIAPSLAEQILAAMGNLEDLETQAKESLVLAINEARETGAGEDGGYYTPSMVREGDTLVFRFSPSQEEMAPVSPVRIVLPGTDTEGLASAFLPQPETATVGQVLKVAAVDENGWVTQVCSEDVDEGAPEFFDLTALGLPAMSPNGSMVQTEEGLDLDAMLLCLSRGQIKIRIALKMLSGSTETFDAVVNPVYRPTEACYQLLFLGEVVPGGVRVTINVFADTRKIVGKTTVMWTDA